MNSKVSICLPVYNGEKFLKRTLDCLLNQSFNNFELIISDDGSSDNTREICLKYAEMDPRIKYFRQFENFGMPVKNFRFALSKASAEYCVFVSHDDDWNVNFIEKMVEILDGDKECSLAFSDYKIFNLQGAGELLIGVSSSTANSAYTRYLSRIVDIQPALIFGMFRRDMVNEEDLGCYDFFEVNFGLLMSLRGKIRVANGYLMSWGIDGERISYSITGKKISYLPFFISQLKLITNNFSSLKVGFPVMLISLFIIKAKLKRFFKPKSFNLKFDK